MQWGHKSYFRIYPQEGLKNYLVFPWAKGTTLEAMLAFYDEVEHTDYVHAISGAPIIKAQHPDYELYLTGIHAYRNVSCADCHMPYRTEGGEVQTKPAALTMIPYYAWCHRGANEMAVWLPKKNLRKKACSARASWP